MKITECGLQWLSQHQPLLAPRMTPSKIAGILEVSAYYDRDDRQVVTGGRAAVGSNGTFVADQFAIDIQLEDCDANGWPRVYEVGMRHASIARRYKIPVADLHFYLDGSACLGLPYPWDPTLTLKDFVTTLVEPFFYRLAYVDVYGVTAARTDLWPEYSHGWKGLEEHKEDIRRWSSRRRR